jgi:hypothetical protein
MAFAGLKSLALAFSNNSEDSTVGINRTDPAGFQQLFDGPQGISGSHTEEDSVAMPARTLGGYKSVTYVDDFYNRVHFLPSPLTFGAISNDTPRTLAVWNAHLVAQDLNAITIDSFIGVVYGGSSLPLTFKPLQEIGLLFTAQAEGPPSFSVATDFDFDLGSTYEVVFIGDRAVVVERGPNWRDNVVETIEFKTEIVHRSRSGREQRRALRQEPRRVMSYTLSTWADTRRAAEGRLTRWRRRPVLMPMWPWKTFTTAATAVSGSILTVDPVPNWAVDGASVMISHPDLSGNIIGSVDSTTPTTIVLGSAVTEEIPVGASVTLMMTGRIRDGQKMERATADIGEMPVSYDVVPGIDAVYTPPAATLFHDSLEVFMTGPNWRDGIEETWDMPLDEVDMGWGQVDFYEAQDFAEYVMRVVYSGLRYDKVQDVVDLFYRQKGQRGEFWMPTFGRDIVPGYQLDESATVIRIEGVDFATDWAGQATNAALIVWLADGSYLLRNVVSISTTTDAFGTDSVIDVDVAWAEDVPVSDIVKISWLMRVRFASDTLRIDWQSDQVADTQFSVRTQEAL